jgi:hypothetical protein
MCDYSLTGVASRPAQVAETLVSTQFGQGTRGFASVDDSNVAVCLRPGSEIAFLDSARVHGMLFHKTLRERLARFRKINIDEPHQHHDALEFADGTVVLLNDLVPGQRALVVQLPTNPNQRGRRPDEVEPARVETAAT